MVGVPACQRVAVSASSLTLALCLARSEDSRPTAARGSPRAHQRSSSLRRAEFQLQRRVATAPRGVGRRRSCLQHAPAHSRVERASNAIRRASSSKADGDQVVVHARRAQTVHCPTFTRAGQHDRRRVEMTVFACATYALSVHARQQPVGTIAS